VALVSSVGFGVATAAKNIVVPPGNRVILLAEDHSAPTLEWMQRAPAQGFVTEAVSPGADGDWTAALLEAIERPGAQPVALASISSVTGRMAGWST
jgi:selenocysteine lyase/cysteine desulfurase